MPCSPGSTATPVERRHRCRHRRVRRLPDRPRRRDRRAGAGRRSARPPKPACPACASCPRSSAATPGSTRSSTTSPSSRRFSTTCLSRRFVASRRRRARPIGGSGFDFAAEIAPECRTLIPSDLGAHNALRGADGKLYFLDFEYFGWDDPVTSIANFVMHPGMQLSEPQRASYQHALLRPFPPTRRSRSPAGPDAALCPAMVCHHTGRTAARALAAQNAEQSAIWAAGIRSAASRSTRRGP